MISLLKNSKLRILDILSLSKDPILKIKNSD